MIRACVALLFALLVAACGAKQFDSLCTAIPAPEGCGEACDPTPGAASSCDTGYFCSPDGACDIQCTLGGTQCGDGYECTVDGRCVDDGKGGENGADVNCPAVNFTPMPTTPSIGLLLDQQRFDGHQLRRSVPLQCAPSALDDTTGVVTSLEGKAYFGSEPRCSPTIRPVEALHGSPRAEQPPARFACRSLEDRVPVDKRRPHGAITQVVATSPPTHRPLARRP